MNPHDLITWTQNHLVRFAQSSFLLKADDGSVLYFDLFQPVADHPRFPARSASAVFITHPHRDHFNAEVVKSVLGPDTRVVTPASMKASGEDLGVATDALAPGESAQIGPFAVRAVAAYTIGREFHPQDKAWVGYLVSVDGVTVYHAGDTDLVPEMTGLKPDVALLPVGGLFTMHWDDAVRAATVLGNPVVVPMHYGMIPFTGGKGRRFSKAYSGVTVLL